MLVVHCVIAVGTLLVLFEDPLSILQLELPADHFLVETRYPSYLLLVVGAVAQVARFAARSLRRRTAGESPVLTLHWAITLATTAVLSLYIAFYSGKILTLVVGFIVLLFSEPAFALAISRYVGLCWLVIIMTLCYYYVSITSSPAQLAKPIRMLIRKSPDRRS